jgi:hypothetical protein
MTKVSWTEKLKARWELKNSWQVVIVLIVFTCTGFTVLWLKPFIMMLFTGTKESETLGTVLYYIFILPLYNVILLGYGFVFGQFHFFWRFEKQFIRRLSSIFNKQK